jgi:Carboxypeptidase regulatory-like domain
MKKQSIKPILSIILMFFLNSCSEIYREAEKTSDYKLKSELVVDTNDNKQMPNRQIKANLGIIKGQVIDENGNPFQGAKVYAAPVDESFKGRNKYVMSDENGFFTILDVKDGKYSIHAFCDEKGYGDTLFAFYVSPQNSIQAVEMKSGNSVETVIVKLGEKNLMLVGQVIDEKSKQPIEKVSQIKLCRDDNSEACIFISPNLKTGQFQIAVPVTKIKIKVTAENYKEIETVENFAATEGKELILEIARAN